MEEAKRPPVAKIFHIYPAMIKLGSYTLLKEDPENILITLYKRPQRFFNGTQKLLLYQEIQI